MMIYIALQENYEKGTVRFWYTANVKTPLILAVLLTNPSNQF